MNTLKNLLVEKEISQEKFDGMSAEEKAGIFNELNEANVAAFKALQDSTEANAVAIAEANKQLVETQNEQIKQINKALETQGVTIKRLTADESAAKVVTLGSTLDKGLNANIDELKTMKTGWVTFKAVGNITSANISGGNVPVEQRLAGLDGLATRQPRFLELVTRGNTTSNIVSWVSKANQEGAAGGTAEGAVKNQIDFDLVVSSESAVKRTAFIKVSTEMLNDVEFLKSEIDNELLVELKKDIENQAYQGNGTAPNMNGARTVATAFSAVAPFGAASVDNANEADVLVAAMNLIEAADQDPANAVLMHPSDVNILKTIKVSTTDKRYVDRLMNIGSSVSIDGVPIVKSTMVTQGEYLVGHFPNILVLDHESMEIQMGLDSDDFTKNMRTIIAEWRGLTIVKTNKRASLIKGVFAADITAITV